MSDQEWDQIMAVHLKGSYACAKAAWPHFQKQGFGRIVNTASAAGLYGAYLYFLRRPFGGFMLNTHRKLRTSKLQRGKDGLGWFHQSARS